MFAVAADTIISCAFGRWYGPVLSLSFLDVYGIRILILEVFDSGKRRCLGEKLANMSNFLFFANLLQAFSFRFDFSSELLK
jgi:hypothetical protein